MRRSLVDDEWAERVWERFERRRDLPRRRLEAALREAIEPVLELVLRILRR